MVREKARRGVSLCFCLLTLFMGCSLRPEQHVNKSMEDGYPMRFIDASSSTVSIEARPERLISLSPSMTEIIYQLGAGGRLVGRTDYCDYPEATRDVLSVGSILEPNVEQIAVLQPDLIVADGFQSIDWVQAMRERGEKVVILKNNQTVDGTFQLIRDVGKLIACQEEAEETIRAMEKEFSSIQEKVKRLPQKKTVYYSIAMGDDGLYTAGGHTYLNELMERAGLLNVANDQDGWSYSLEALYHKDPEVLLCSDKGGERQRILSFVPIQSLSAVREGRVIEICADLLERQGPRNVEGVRMLFEKVYGDAV